MHQPRVVLCLLAVLVASVAALMASPSAHAASACEAAGATPAQAAHREMVRATLCMLNSQRDRHGVAPLRLNARLSEAATLHAEDMDRRNYFSHDSLGGGSFVDRIRQSGYLRGARAWSVGENLAWGTHWRSTPRRITQMWMNSPGHRANVLSPAFREVGIGVAYGAPVARGGRPAATYAIDFGFKG